MKEIVWFRYTWFSLWLWFFYGFAYGFVLHTWLMVLGLCVRVCLCLDKIQKVIDT